MKYFHLEGEMCDELVQKFMVFASENHGEAKTCYLDSPGGSCTAAYVIGDIINNDHENFTLVASNQILSSAFELFYSALCKKYILPDTIGAYHLSGNTYRVNAAGKYDNPLAEFVMAEMKRAGLESDRAFCEKVCMSPEEMAKILEGGDVFFSNDRLHKLKLYV